MNTRRTVVGVLIGFALSLGAGCTDTVEPEYADLRVVVGAATADFYYTVIVGQVIDIVVAGSYNTDNSNADYTVTVSDQDSATVLGTENVSGPAPYGVGPGDTAYGAVIGYTVVNGPNTVNVYEDWEHHYTGAPLLTVNTVDRVSPAIEFQIAEPPSEQTMGQDIDIQVFATNYNGSTSELSVTVGLVDNSDNTQSQANLNYTEASDSFSGTLSTDGLIPGNFTLVTTVTDNINLDTVFVIPYLIK